MILLNAFLGFICSIIFKLFCETEIPSHLQAKREDDPLLTTFICPVGRNLHRPSSH